jgi:hypothetical protein
MKRISRATYLCANVALVVMLFSFEIYEARKHIQLDTSSYIVLVMSSIAIIACTNIILWAGLRCMHIGMKYWLK